ncbi:hypothetical protein chiPu_0027205 [Chiloscyllium punctatum]|uniref:Uncharacterized protein n=1 Tax=Chiloscyllium punctatum TaxID=137246 RepID=A0A401TJS5_CHIPU|nr:hypothetical protein [Chiloscyllium punctatum]
MAGSSLYRELGTETQNQSWDRSQYRIPVSHMQANRKPAAAPKANENTGSSDSAAPTDTELLNQAERAASGCNQWENGN